MLTRSSLQWMKHFVTYSQVKGIVEGKLADSPALKRTLLVDVRSAMETRRYGMIPTAINIPLPVVQEVLNPTGDVDEEEFMNVYQVEKPKPETHQLVFYCQHGARSASAAEIAESLGFRSISNYGGSFAEWAAESKKQ